MVYLNPGGHNWGPKNDDGYGISTFAFGIVYTIVFYAACLYLWLHRNHPSVKMRNIPLSLAAVLVLHVYLFMVFAVYYLNGLFPCNVEFWSMSMYLPLGIGLFQASNQDLLIVSREQIQLMHTDHSYKPLPPGYGQGFGGPRYWAWRFKLWWQRAAKQNKYEAFIFVGMLVQFTVSVCLFCMSRKFNSYGIYGHHTSPGLCRRGLEWLPSIVWQFIWNFILGPYQIWEVRMVRDIYKWRLQTIIAIVAGLPGTPLWIASVYTDSLGGIDKYWVPCMWFAPGLITMELVTLSFPIYLIRKHIKATKERVQILKDFDLKKTGSEQSSVATPSTGAKSGKMFTMESLEECLNGNSDSLQVYASGCELTGENIIFLLKVNNFVQQYPLLSAKAMGDVSRARMTTFRAALSIYVSLVHADTARYPINIESPIYAKLHSIFGAAAKLVAIARPSSPATPVSAVTPWDEPADPITSVQVTDSKSEDYPMQSMPPRSSSLSNDSSEHIICLDEPIGPTDPTDPLAGFQISQEFNAHVFDEAFSSIKYMVWTWTWQRYMTWKNRSSTSTTTSEA